MTFDAVVPLLTGGLAGIIHALSGPDHLAAVAPLVADRPQSGWRSGFSWGVGHTIGVWVLAVLAVIVKRAVPLDRLASWAELGVGVVLVVMGLWALRRALTYRIHTHDHSHDGARHRHIHFHKQIGDGHERVSHTHSHAPTGVGLLHGLAGGSHLFAILPAILLSRVGLVAYVVGYGIGSILAMTMFAWFVGNTLNRWIGRHATAYSVVTGAIAVVAVCVGVAWLVKWHV